MTRDDAIKAVRLALAPPGTFISMPDGGGDLRAAADDLNRKRWNDATHFVDAAAALGLLQFSQPRGFGEKIRDFMSDARLAQGLQTERVERLWCILDDCGLTIVEKK